MTNLFDEILNCADCPKVDQVTDQNEQQIREHLQNFHHGVSVNAFIVANRQKERESLDSLYNKTKEYLGGDFKNHFLREFHQRCWEVCVCKYLLDNGIKIFKSSGKKGRPDFETAIGYVECTAVGPGINKNTVPLLEATMIDSEGKMSGPGFQEIPMNAIKLRVASRIKAKIDKFEIYSSEPWFDTAKPIILAINWFAEGVSVTSGHGIESHPVLQVLFGTGYPQIVINNSTNEVYERLSIEPILFNANGSPVPVAYFQDPDSIIDGVIMDGGSPIFYSPNNYEIIKNPLKNSFDLNYFSLGHQREFLLSN